MKGRDLRADLQFVGTTCDVTVVPHRTRLKTRLTNTNQKRTPPLPDPFHASYRTGRDQNKSHYTTSDTDPLCRVVPEIKQIYERSDADYPLCVPQRMFRLKKLVNMPNCSSGASLLYKTNEHTSSGFLRRVTSRPAGPCTRRQHDPSRSRVPFANRQGTTSQKI